MKEKFKIGVLVLMLFVTKHISAQEAILSAGGNAYGNNASTSYSIGQVVYTLYVGEYGYINQGVQQPYEISVTTNIERFTGITLSAFPNPSNEYLILEAKNFEISNLNFHLYDISGKLLQSDRVTGNQINIVMSSYAPNTYFLKVIQDNKELKVFKIIKK